MAYVVFDLGGHEESPYCIVYLEVSLYAYFVASVPEFFIKSSYVWHYYVYVVGGTAWILGGCKWPLMLCLWLNFN